jgi:hypothetical protein
MVSRVMAMCLGLVLAVVATVCPIQAAAKAGLVQMGVDTLNVQDGRTFQALDFVLGKVCSSCDLSPTAACYCHIAFFSPIPPMPAYPLEVPDGYGMLFGKLNLDSVRAAPPDSVLTNRPQHRIDTLFWHPDSLRSYIGNVYVMKTGTDARVHFPFFAKIKILKFIVRDTVTHDIDMVFLWVCNESGYTDLQSAVDTFTLDTLPVSTSPSARTRISSPSSRASAYAVLRVARTGLVVTGERGVWDLRGRRVALWRRAVNTGN